MSKSVATRWYIGAWVVGAISTIVFFVTAHAEPSGTGTSSIGTSPVSVIAWILAGVCALVMLVTWIGTLVRLGQVRAWGWFVFMFALQLIGLGIVPMAAYAVAGPQDREPAVTRPSVT